MNQPRENNSNASAPVALMDTEAAIVALDDAQFRAAGQRIAAELLLAEARAVEERLAAAAGKAREVNERGSARRLAAAAEEARQREVNAKWHALECDRAAERAVAERATAEAAERRQQTERVAAATAAASAEERAIGARAALQRADAALADSTHRVEELTATEQVAASAAHTASNDLLACKTAREEAETAARAAVAESDGILSPAKGALDELFALEARSGIPSEAARRIAERRAADAARSADAAPNTVG